MFNLNEIRKIEKKLKFQYFRNKEQNKECVIIITVLKKYKDKYLVTDTFSYFYILIDLNKNFLNKKDILLNKSFMDFEMEELLESEIVLNDFVSSDILENSNTYIPLELKEDICINISKQNLFKSQENILSSLHYSDFDIKTDTLPEILSLKSRLSKKGLKETIKEINIELLIYHRYQIKGIFNGEDFIVYEINNVNYKELCDKIFPTYKNLDEFLI